jgi:adenylylsulfate kinase
VAFIGTVLTERGVPVLFDATANRRAYRDRARKQIPKFIEVYIDSPLELCMKRDPKGIYRSAVDGKSKNVPGLQVPYEPPLSPEIVIRGDRERPEEAATRVIDFLAQRGWVT